MLTRNGVEFSLDTPEAVPVGFRDCILAGWCFTRSEKAELQVGVLMGERFVPAFIGLERDDVARYFKYPGASHSGFIVRFRRPVESTHICIAGRLNGMEFPLATDVPIPGCQDHAGDVPVVGSYKDWILCKESALFWNEAEIKSTKLESLTYKPVISIILPTYNTPPYFLKRCIESVIDQHYVNWQLCVTDDNSPDCNVFSSLQEFAQMDSRICIQRSGCQSGISSASNCSLDLATGDFVVLLDHDDELHPHALLELARSINEFPSAKMFYSDEDKIDGVGVRSQPAFKPDFDEDIFCSFNYLGHMIALKRSLVTSIGGFRPSCDGAQDWDLLLRATEQLNPAEIKHISKPLYHWRMHSNSTSLNLDSKPYVSEAWSRVLEDHVRRAQKCSDVTEGLFHGSMRLKYPAAKDVEVAVFLRAQDGAFQEAIVRTNAGRRRLHLYQTIDCAVFEMESAQLAAAASGQTYHQGSQCLCSLTEIKGDLFVFINGPLESLSHLFFEELIAQGMREDCALVTGLSVDNDNRILSSGFVRVERNEMIDPYVDASFPRHGYMGQINVVRKLDACPDIFFAVRRQHLARVGGLASVSSARMPDLVRNLSLFATQNDLAILATPYAVATFSEVKKPATPRVTGEDEPQRSVRLNPQIFSFAQPEAVLQGKLE